MCKIGKNTNLEKEWKGVFLFSYTDNEQHA